MTVVDFARKTVRNQGRRLDPVLVALAAIVVALLVLLPEQGRASILFVADALGGITPFILVSAAVAAYAGAAGLDRLLGRAFRGRGGRVIVAAALFGALSPFCSCGVVPIIAALLAAGMPLPAIMAFWVASPVMDPEMYILTAARLGAEFATAKTLAAVAIGIGGGFATLGLERLGLLTAPLRAAAPSCAASRLSEPAEVCWAVWRQPRRRAAFVLGLGASAWFLGRWLALAFLLESLMVAWLPAESIAGWLGNDSAWAIPAAALAGVPAYLNGYAAIPTVDALMSLGMAPGAALAFMVSGAVTSIPAAVAVLALVRRPVFVWYLALAFAAALAAGYGYQGWLAW